MLIIPVGQEHGEVRRDPWISYGIVAVNVIVFLLLAFASMKSDAPDRFEAKAREVTEYVVRNPHLHLPPELVPFYGSGALAAAREALRRAREHPEYSGQWRDIVERNLIALSESRT